MKDLVVMVADKNAQFALTGALNRPEAMGTRRIQFEFRVHPGRDGGARKNGPEMLALERSRFTHGLLIMDFEGSGTTCADALELDADLNARLQRHWLDRAKAIVIEPEVDIWMWGSDNVLRDSFQWEEHRRIRDWLRDQGYQFNDLVYFGKGTDLAKKIPITRALWNGAASSHKGKPPQPGWWPETWSCHAGLSIGELSKETAQVRILRILPMTKTELLELITNGESSGLEFKRDDIDNRALAKELVAFANLMGGHVLLGVEDDGSISGITRPTLEDWVMTTCRDKIRPEIIPYFEVVRDVEPGKNIAVVTIERGWGVHSVWHNAHRSYYTRVGTQSREASPEELERLFQQRGAFRLEIRPVSGSSLSDLDRRRLKDYFARARNQSMPQDEDVEGWKTLLVNTEILSEEGDRAVATVAALLLFGNNPNRFLPQAGIDVVAYPGREKDYAARERASLRAPIVSLFQVDGSGKVLFVENGLVEQAIEFVRRNTEVASVLKGGVRFDRWTYPEEAMREAIVNALVHRDYLLSGTTIELSIYEDRLEVISPGRLPNGITPARMKTGCRAARNQLLKDVMRDYNYLEHTGMGVPRKIVKGMLEHNGTEPDLIEEEERFTVRLWK